jgi:hypothetical protein
MIDALKIIMVVVVMYLLGRGVMEGVIRLPIRDLRTFGQYGRMIIGVATIRPGRFYYKVGILSGACGLAY